MLTKEQDKSLSNAIKKFIELMVTSPFERVWLYYSKETDTFFAEDSDRKRHKKDKSIEFILMENTKTPNNWDCDDWDRGVDFWSEEVKHILEYHDSLKYHYPQEVIDNILKLAESKKYNIEDVYECEQLLERSGAADFIKEVMDKEDIEYYIYNDSEDLENKAIRIFEED